MASTDPTSSPAKDRASLLAALRNRFAEAHALPPDVPLIYGDAELPPGIAIVIPPDILAVEKRLDDAGLSRRDIVAANVTLERLVSDRDKLYAKHRTEFLEREFANMKLSVEASKQEAELSKQRTLAAEKEASEARAEAQAAKAGAKVLRV